MLTDEERTRLAGACTRWLSGHGVASMRDRLLELAELPGAGRPPDVYGVGDPVSALERRTADLLGKPAAKFVIKGVMAQQAALRVWADDRGHRTVVLHPLSHLDLDEMNAIETLHPLRSIRLGRTGPFGVTELDRVTEPIGVVTVELPLRRAGFALLEWDELAVVSGWCRERGIPLHVDGARLWESAPYYGRSLAEIAALADSVYVSFYKGLGGLAGCVLAGPVDFLGRAAPWLSRLGANVFAQYPYALAAMDGLDRHLPEMAARYARATSLAAALAAAPGVRVTRPQTNAFALFLPGTPEGLDAAHARLARRTGVWLLGRFAATEVPGVAKSEVSVGAATDDIPDDEAAGLLAAMLADADAG